jgi:hypothetical protein
LILGCWKRHDKADGEQGNRLRNEPGRGKPRQRLGEVIGVLAVTATTFSERKGLIIPAVCGSF